MLSLGTCVYLLSAPNNLKYPCISKTLAKIQNLQLRHFELYYRHFEFFCPTDFMAAQHPRPARRAAMTVIGIQDKLVVSMAKVKPSLHFQF